MKQNYEIDLKNKMLEFDKYGREVRFGHLYDLVYYGNKKPMDIMDVIARGIYDKNATIKLVVEYEDEILDEIEKKYLENLLRPFKNEPVTIKKLQDGRDLEYLLIEIGWYDNELTFPSFGKDTMYKGMEVGYEYDIEELKLFQKRVDK